MGRREEIVIGEFHGKGPGDLFEDGGGGEMSGSRIGRRKKKESSSYAVLAYGWRDAGDFDGPWGGGSRELLAEFAGRRALLERPRKRTCRRGIP